MGNFLFKNLPILMYPYESFTKPNDYNEEVTELRNDHCFPKTPGKIPSDEEIARRSKIKQNCTRNKPKNW